MQSINITKTNTVAFTSPAGTGLAVRMPGELIPQNVALFLFFTDSVYNGGMNKEAALMFLCFSAVLTAGLAGCARTDGVAGAGKVEASYPDVWERVLPEEMQTNIANYGAGLLYPVEKEHTDLLDYAVSVSWKIDEVYHIDGEDHDDVIFRFSDSDAGINKNYNVLYYSFFDGRLLNNNNRYTFLPGATVHDIVPNGSFVRRLSFIDTADAKKWASIRAEYISKITLVNGVIYDANIEDYRYRDGRSKPYYPDVTCHDPPEWGIDTAGIAIKDYWTSHEEGVQFLPVGYTKKDIAREDSWLLVQGLDEPRFVTKYCRLLRGARIPIRVYSYYEYSFVRTNDDIILLPDGTFLFAGIRNSFPIFHIVRLHPDMSIPLELKNRYRWIRYKDYVGILDIYESYERGKLEKGELFGSEYNACPMAVDSYPSCKRNSEESCTVGRGMEYERAVLHLDGHPYISDLDKGTLSILRVCLNLALRDYVRGKFEIYHCRNGDETVASLTPCDEREKQ